MLQLIGMGRVLVGPGRVLVGLAVVASLSCAILSCATSKTNNFSRLDNGQVNTKGTQQAPPSPYFLSPVRSMTFEGRRAGEAYFDPTSRAMIFQSERHPGNPFFQIYLKTKAGTHRISPGTGKTTCAWLHPKLKTAIFSSTHEDPDALNKQKQEYKERAKGGRRYAWDYDPHYDIYEARLPRSVRKAALSPTRSSTHTPSASSLNRGFKVGRLKNLTRSLGYDAEASYSPDGRWIAFASNRSAYNQQLWQKAQAKISKRPADRWLAQNLSPEHKALFLKDPSAMMDIYIMRHDGTGVKRLTTAMGYDGGPFFSPDGKSIVWRRFDLTGHKAEVWTMNIDGRDKKQITNLGKMSWAPYYHPSGDYIIFATNKHGYKNFELYVVDTQGKKTLRVTDLEGFDGLPVFTPSGDALYWTRRQPSGMSQIFKAVWNDARVRRDLGLPPAFQTVSPLQPAQRIKNEKLWLKNTVYYFASEHFKGRLTASPEEVAYTRDIADYFKHLGLKAYRGQYVQTFKVSPQSFTKSAREPKSKPSFKRQLDNQVVHKKLVPNENFITARNVLAFLPVRGATSTVVIGAHGDHLGTGQGPNSLATNKDKNLIHYGADDNASGMAVVLSLARHYALQPKGLRHNLLFAVWSGEEQGTLGSSYFLQQHHNAGAGARRHSSRRNSNNKRNRHGHGGHIKAYLNFDMVGHLNQGPLIVQGVGSSKAWPRVIENLRPRIALSLQNDPYVSTDAMPFYLKKHPVLSFFTGAHKFYHSPRDTADTLDYEGLYKVQQFAVKMLNTLQHAGPLNYEAVKAPRKQQRQGLRLYLGTVPDYASQAKGLKLAGVVGGGPAEKAGLQEGDVIIKLHNIKIQNIYDYAQALQKLKPEPMKLVLLRQGVEKVLNISPTLRK